MSHSQKKTVINYFPKIVRNQVDTLQINLTLRCNQACVHCHVDAGPKRTERMADETIESILSYLSTKKVNTLDITGGAPEMHPRFRYLVDSAHALGVHIIDRCNLTILLEDGYEGLAEYLASKNIEIVASLPCYSEENVDQQRGKGVFTKSIQALNQLNALGYGQADSGKKLSLVYNPQNPVLPPDQKQLEKDYKNILLEKYGIYFNELLVLCNMPINRFAHMLDNQGSLNDYMLLLKNSYSAENLEHVMCRSMVSVDWQGYVYDCDFNQMLNLNLMCEDKYLNISELSKIELEGKKIIVNDHCFACTAGQGSSCGGALQSA